MKHLGFFITISVCLALLGSNASAVCEFPENPPLVIHPEYCGCVGDGVADDTSCWQDAINAARGLFYMTGPSGESINFMGAVEGAPTANYRITGTLVIQDIFGGVVAGNDAHFTWAGPAGIPMWKIADAQGFKIENMTIRSSSSAPLDTAFLITNANNTPQGHSNVVEHVKVDGTNAGGLQYGVKIAPGPGGDVGNDGNVIRDSQFGNVSSAGIYLEGQNAHRQSFYDVYASAECGTGSRCPGTYYVHMVSGSFTSIGGAAWGFETQFYLQQSGSGGAVHIVDPNAEGCGHFLKNSIGNSSAWNPIHVTGGRFATDFLDADCKIVEYTGLGPFSIEKIAFGGWTCTPGSSNCPPTTCAGNPVLHFRASPQPPSATGRDSRIVVSGVEFGMKNRAGYFPASPAGGWDPIVLAGNGYGNYNRLVSFQNACLTDAGQGICRGLASGIGYTSMTKSDLDATVDLASGHQSYCSDCRPWTSPCAGGGTGAVATRMNGAWDCGGGVVTPTGAQALSNKDLTAATNTFPSSLVTLTGAQALTNKNLTDPTNLIPTAPTDVVFLVVPSTSATAWSNMPAAVTEVFGTTTRRVKVDLSRFTQFRIECAQGAVSASSAKLRLQYAFDARATTWYDLENGSTIADLALASASPPPVAAGSWGQIHANARADVFVRVVGTGGDGAKDPSFHGLRAQFR